MKHNRSLSREYETYCELLTGRISSPIEPVPMKFRSGSPSDLEHFHSDYLRNQILHWGGIIPELFPETCLRLTNMSVGLNEFVRYFYETPGTPCRPYDYFVWKIERFRDFIRDLSNRTVRGSDDSLVQTADREYRSCLEAYRTFNPED